ncbi:hypothetical protein ACFRU3_31955 [Streptomyces sp. NPDC056910]|uniref:hypothetical protein n=1 Tax=Streptomyces sp. NPDC056910 TaxID=3345964 RepID=UPI003696565D
MGPDRPGDWTAVTRIFRDGHTATWWAADAQLGWWGPDGTTRLVVVTTDPATLPAQSTWYLATDLSRPGGPREADSPAPAADLAEIVRIYGIRHWIEQSYKQVKDELGWADFQVRSDTAIRRHQTLVTCAFSFCWDTWFAPPHLPRMRRSRCPAGQRRGIAPSHQTHQTHQACWPQALRDVRGWLTPWATLQRYWRAWTAKPPLTELQALINAVGTGRPLNLYIPA